MLKYLYAFLVLACFSGIFILIYYFNSKTKKPEGCDETPEECLECKASFCYKKKTSKNEKEN